MRNRPFVTRRSARILAAAMAFVSIACSLGRSQETRRRDGRLSARPASVAAVPSPGQTALSIARGRDGFMYVPANLPPGPAPLVLLLHGAGGAAQNIMNRLSNVADSVGFVVLVPDSRGPTWDAIRGDYGPDIAYIDSALKLVFARVSIDPSRVIASGFSDGASYALGLARINGDLFTRVVAFSPGFVTPGMPAGKPEVYITHGNADPILPFGDTSERIVAAMKRAGYSVTLKQFSGGHTVPLDLAREAYRWAIAPRAAKAAR
jgi:phospholipase/carboxylesterase